MGIECVNGNSQSPQTQNLEEQSNGVAERKIRAWKMEHNSTRWQDALLEVVCQINSHMHSSTRHTPYGVVFRQNYHTSSWYSSQDRKNRPIATKDGTIYSEWDLPDVDLGLRDQLSTLGVWSSHSNQMSTSLQASVFENTGADSPSSTIPMASVQAILFPNVVPACNNQEESSENEAGPVTQGTTQDDHHVDSEEERLFERELANLQVSGGTARPLWEQEGIGRPSRPIEFFRPQAPTQTEQNDAVIQDVQQQHI